MSGQRAEDERFMREAMGEARVAASLGEVPIGAVVVHEGRVIARAHNRRELDEDPSAHAEFSAMMEASRVLGRWRLTGCTVYVTLEPCLMCSGLMVNARIDRCVYGAADPKGGAVGTLYDVSGDPRLNHAFEVTSGVLQDECAAVLREFFQGLRAARKGGSGLSGDAPEEGSRPGCVSAALSRPDGSGRAAEASPAVKPGPLSVSAKRGCVILAIDSFKGSASSSEVEAWLAEGMRGANPELDIVSIPVADGGEGTMEAFRAGERGEACALRVTGPAGAMQEASYLMVDECDGNPAAVVEMAQAAGISFSTCTHEAALAATTRGVGELMLAAVRAGAKVLYVGLGGSATTDGGAGMLQALGARVLDAAGNEVAPGLVGLRDVVSIDLAPAREVLAGVQIKVLSDVKSPLVGQRGAVREFGPQKGLGTGFGDAEREEALTACDRWMVAYGARLTAARDALDGTELQVGAAGARPKSLAGVPGAGAAGGLGAALLALGAELASGVDVLLDLVQFDELAHGACAVVTGEGAIDAQTAEGKAPAGVARRAKRVRADVPVYAVCGSRAADLERVYATGIDAVLPIEMGPQALEQALASAQTRANLIAMGETLARLIAPLR